MRAIVCLGTYKKKGGGWMGGKAEISGSKMGFEGFIYKIKSSSKQANEPIKFGKN